MLGGQPVGIFAFLFNCTPAGRISMRQFQCVPTTYVTEIKETYFETSVMSIGFASFKHLKLPISIKIHVTIYLHDSYITKFDFMNYAFAKLLPAQLYHISFLLLTTSDSNFERGSMSKVFRLSVRLSVRQPRCNPGFHVGAIFPARVCQIVITLHDN